MTQEGDCRREGGARAVIKTKAPSSRAKFNKWNSARSSTSGGFEEAGGGATRAADAELAGDGEASRA